MGPNIPERSTLLCIKCHGSHVTSVISARLYFPGCQKMRMCYAWVGCPPPYRLNLQGSSTISGITVTMNRRQTQHQFEHDRQRKTPSAPPHQIKKPPAPAEVLVVPGKLHFGRCWTRYRRIGCLAIRPLPSRLALLGSSPATARLIRARTARTAC